MLKDIVLKQKQEKELLLSFEYIERGKSHLAKRWLDSDLIKVVLGPRRAGKSVFSLMLLRGRQFMYFNFDDESLFGNNGLNADELMKELHLAYGETKTILFDEIQNFPNWELFVNRLQREGYNLILTGSNANLLSKELATALTGRHIPIEIMPFDFNEFLLAKNYQIDQEFKRLPQNRGKILKLVEAYLFSGGFPEVVVKDIDSRGYLDVLFDSLLFKDVVKRHKVKFSSQIDNLGSYLINNFSNYYSLRRIQEILNFRSITTTEKYTRYLEEAYLIFSLRRYSPKAGERIKSPKKVYVVDNGFVIAKAVQHSPDFGRLMENSVFVELVKRGFQPNRNIFYYKTRNNREVDFVIKKEMTIDELIQVCYESENPDVEEREIKALIETSHELSVKGKSAPGGKVRKLTVITWDTKKEERFKSKKIKFIPLWKWLLE